MAQDEGLSEEESVQLQTFMGVAMGCGSLLFGLVVLSRSDQCLISRQYLLQAAMMGIGELNKRKRAFLNYGVTIFFGKLPVVSSFSTPARHPRSKRMFHCKGWRRTYVHFHSSAYVDGGKRKKGVEGRDIRFMAPSCPLEQSSPPPSPSPEKSNTDVEREGERGGGKKTFLIAPQIVDTVGGARL